MSPFHNYVSYPPDINGKQEQQKDMVANIPYMFVKYVNVAKLIKGEYET